MSDVILDVRHLVSGASAAWLAARGRRCFIHCPREIVGSSANPGCSKV